MADDEVVDQVEAVEEPPEEEPTKEELTVEEPTEDKSIEEGRSPAPVSPWWITAAVGAAMLVIGLFLGYIGRGSFGPEAMAAKATQSAQVSLIQTQQANNREIMDMLIEQTRHFKGEETAPVTIIEFSDFQ